MIWRCTHLEELFANNQSAIYIIACLAVITYTNFKENQRMLLIYFLTYAIASFTIFRISVSLCLLFLITFIYIEYLSEDEKKLEIITTFRYKLLDYAFMMIFQYQAIIIIFSFILLHISHINNCPSIFQNIATVSSIFIFVLGAQRTISQPFKIKNITEMLVAFENVPIYQFEYKAEMQEKFELLCEFEDKTYFQRKNSYSCISLEYFKCFFENHGINNFRDFLSTVYYSIFPIKCHHNGITLLHIKKRGYSTPEMQLIRTIGVARGYDKYKISRKFFEVIYSKILFSSLKRYHKTNTYLALEHYRQYLLNVYFHTVLTKINDKRISPFSSAFENPSDITNWSMEGLFIACLGLGFRKVSDYNLERYEDIIIKYNLDIERIKELNLEFSKNKFPSNNKNI